MQRYLGPQKEKQGQEPLRKEIEMSNMFSGGGHRWNAERTVVCWGPISEREGKEACSVRHTETELWP